MMLVMALVLAVPVHAESGSIADALTSGDAALDLRYRYEFVDQDGFSEDAHASTLLLRLDYETGSWRNWSGYIQFDHVFEVLLDDFNSGAGTSSPARDIYPVVADPDGPDLNQLFIAYRPHDTIDTRIGRQRILLDDQRYVGGVGWRQNEQTYDALTLRYSGLSNTEIFAGYVANVNRIFGEDVPAGDHEQDTFLLNGRVRFASDWQAIGYAYLIDNDDQPSFSTRTFGLRTTGKIDTAGGPVELIAEYARQSDAANNPASFDVNYFRLQADLGVGEHWSVGLGAEVLGSDAGQGFRTPLATLHAFNGWADQFLTTPAEGLEDVYLRIGVKPGKWVLSLIAHDFSAETGSGDFGRELDFSANRKLGDGYGLLVKLAIFDAEDPAFSDTTKFWVMLTAGF